MNKKFINALLFSAALLSTGMVSSCKDYDDDIDALDNRVTAVETTVADLQKKIAEGKWITKFERNASNNGYILTLSDSSTLEIKDGEKGANGTSGTNGTNGTMWQINETTKNWEYKNDGDTDWTDTGVNAQGLPGATGAQGVHAESPYIGKDGNWVIWKWDAEQNKFVEEPTTISASGTTSFVVDKDLYYELHIALGTIDSEGNFTATDKDFSEVRLPKTGNILSMEAYKCDGAKLEEPTSIDLSYAAVKNTSGVKFDGISYKHNQILSSVTSKLTAHINPAEVDVKLYDFTLIDSKGNSIFVLGEPEQNKSEKPLTRAAATDNKGFYDMTISLADGITDADITDGAVYALATTNYQDEQITSRYNIGIAGKETSVTAPTISTAVQEISVEEGTTFAELFEAIVPEAERKNVAAYYFTMPDDQQADAEKSGMVCDKTNRVITAKQASATQVELKFHYMLIDGTVKEGNNAVTVKVQAASEQEVTAGIADVKWTISATSKTVNNIAVTGLNDFIPAGTATISYKFANDVVTVNGKALTDDEKEAAEAALSANTTMNKLSFTKKTDDYGYPVYTASITFDPKAVYAEPMIATVTLKDGNNNTKVVSFNVNITLPEISLTRKTSLFDDNNTAYSYDYASNWDGTNGKVKFDLNTLYSNIATLTSATHTIAFKEADYKYTNNNNQQQTATKWMSGTDGKLAIYPATFTNKGVNEGGVGTEREYTITVTPFGNDKLNVVTDKFTFKASSVVADGEFFWGKPVLDKDNKPTGEYVSGDAINVEFTATDFIIDGANFVGKAIDEEKLSAKFYANTKVSSYTITGDANAKEYLVLNGSEQFSSDKLTVKKSASANIVKETTCVITVTLTDRCGLKTSADVTVILKPAK